MAKLIKAYSLDEDAIKYIHKKAKELDKSDSFTLNHLLTQLALQDTVNTKNKTHEEANKNN